MHFCEHIVKKREDIEKMGTYHKDYETILAELKKVEEEIETMRANASRLNKEADAAEGVLQDDVAKNSIAGMRGIAEAVFSEQVQEVQCSIFATQRKSVLRQTAEEVASLSAPTSQ